MSVMMPKFANSPYLVMEEDNWHLKPGAPEDVQKEFDEYMEYKRELEKRGIDA